MNVGSFAEQKATIPMLTSAQLLRWVPPERESQKQGLTTWQF